MSSLITLADGSTVEVKEDAERVAERVLQTAPSRGLVRFTGMDDTYVYVLPALVAMVRDC